MENSTKRTFKIKNNYDLIKEKDYQIVENPISVNLTNEGEKINIIFNNAHFNFYNSGEECVGTFDPKVRGKNVIIKLSKGKYPLYFYESKINDFIENISKQNKDAKMKIIFKPATPNNSLEQYDDNEGNRYFFTDNYFHIEFLNCEDFNDSIEKEVNRLLTESERRSSREIIFYDNIDEFSKSIEKIKELEQKVEKLEQLLISRASLSEEIVSEK
ncbi:MAG: hypothetical protein AM1032_000049 [Mycoplasmataceae bacterium]|nr:MAG: hypothetical protein AM1032_000049 [Mycoplasmataceae bacterium]